MKYKKNKMNKKDTKYKLCILLDPRDRKLLCQIALQTSKCLSSITVRLLLQNHNKPSKDGNGSEGSGVRRTLVFLCLAHPSDCSPEMSHWGKPLLSPLSHSHLLFILLAHVPFSHSTLNNSYNLCSLHGNSMMAGTGFLLFPLTHIFLAHSGHSNHFLIM